MAIPWRTRLFWKIDKLVERSPFEAGPDEIAARREFRKKITRMPGATVMSGRTADGVTATDSVARLADGTQLPIRSYRPNSASPGRQLPVVVNFHGGGWVSGDPHQSEWWCSSVSARAGVVVVSVDYRLAPEHPFPVPVEDCYAATVWVAEHANELGVDPARLAVMGDSAGGNLAAVVCLMARDRGGPPIALQILLYPSVELVDEFPSKTENANAPILTKRDMENCPKLYFHNSDRQMSDPYASPLRADHQGLPPALVQTAQFDPLRDEGAAYAKALSEAGVEVRYTNYVDAVHGYISLPRVVPAARQAIGEVVAVIGAHLPG